MRRKPNLLSSEIGGGSEALFSYPLEQAIRDGWLIEFDYLPLEYSRSTEDALRFEEKVKGQFNAMGNGRRLQTKPRENKSLQKMGRRKPTRRTRNARVVRILL